MFAEIASGHVELSDVFLLIAAIFAVLATVVNVARGSVEGALVPAAVAFIALGLFVL